MTECPNCHGHKKVQTLSCPGARLEMTNCYVCSGTGEVDDGFLERRRVGDLARHARVQRMATLHDVAQALGVKPSEVSAMEHGKAPMDDRFLEYVGVSR